MSEDKYPESSKIECGQIYKGNGIYNCTGYVLTLSRDKEKDLDGEEAYLWTVADFNIVLDDCHFCGAPIRKFTDEEINEFEHIGSLMDAIRGRAHALQEHKIEKLKKDERITRKILHKFCQWTHVLIDAMKKIDANCSDYCEQCHGHKKIIEKALNRSSYG
jgi:hypothetical protein